MRDKLKNIFDRIKSFFSIKSRGFTALITAYFTLANVFLIALITFFLSGTYESNLQETTENNSNIIIRQISINIENIINQSINLSENAYYEIIKDYDIDDTQLEDSLGLLYELNSDIVDNISIFDENGELLKSEPYYELSDYSDVSSEPWFIGATDEIENIYFSDPHIEDIFDTGMAKDDWVISVSRSVELNSEGQIYNGVLLVDIKFDAFVEAIRGLSYRDNSYIFLTNNSGELLYHPQLQILNSVNYTDDSSINVDDLDFSNANIMSESKLGYTGWQIYLVNDYETYLFTQAQTRTYVGLMSIIVIAILIFINTTISYRVTRPLNELGEDVTEYKNNKFFEHDKNTGATPEIITLRESVSEMILSQEKLQEDILSEQEAKRRSELEALQAQIHPHFLYNTLDSIVWMIENERYSGATEMVSNLANFFRMSLSRGKSIITLESELEQVRSYLEIQKVRYRDQFEYEIKIDDKIRDAEIIKLVVQPIVENAIYYGTSFIDDGFISIHAYLIDEENIYIDVEDNGMGMSKKKIEQYLSRKINKDTKGSGVGISNVNERIKLFFGRQYGLSIFSEADEGTLVRIHIPYKTYQEDADNVTI